MNENKQLKFETNRRKAEACPCGKSNRDGKFVPYVDFANKGYCHSCDKTFLPEKDYKFVPYVKREEPPVDRINLKRLEDSMSCYENNNFTLFLENTFGTPRAEDMVSKYYIGTTDALPELPKRLKARPIFWQIDEKFRVRTARLIKYTLQTGKRVKSDREEDKPTWIHRYPKQSYKQCLFGLHLISENDKPIAIVESEKSAIIMSYCRSDYNWLATGGISNLSKDKLKPLVGRHITLYPDHNGFYLWKKKAEKITKETGITFKIAPDCEEWYKEGKILEGNDIADYYLINHKFKHDAEWSDEEYKEFNNRICTSENR